MAYAFITILTIALSFSIYKNVVFGLTLLKMEDTLEECLDTIDQKYQKMSEILQRPLFFDSPEVKSVVKEISDVKDSLHKVALVLSKNVVETKEDTDS